MRSVRTGAPLTTVTPGSPQMQVNGKTSVRSAFVNRRRAVIGVCSTSVLVSVPYRPLEKLGAVPICQLSCAYALEGTSHSIAIATMGRTFRSCQRESNGCRIVISGMYESCPIQSINSALAAPAAPVSRGVPDARASRDARAVPDARAFRDALAGRVAPVARDGLAALVCRRGVRAALEVRAA